MNHISEEDLIESIEKTIAFLPTVHIGTVHLEIMLEEYKKEKQKNKELVKVIKNTREMHDIKCKIIDLMAEDIYNSDMNHICKDKKMKEDCYADTSADGKFCGKDCIIDYYFNKVIDVKLI